MMRGLEKKFIEERVKPFIDTYKEVWIGQLADYQKQFKKQVLTSLDELVNQANGSLCYIQFALLQVGILDQSYEVMVLGYDEDWYGSDAISVSFYIDYIFEGLNEIREELYQETKKYMGQVRLASIDKYILDFTKQNKDYFTYFMIRILRQWDEDQSFQKMTKGNQLLITWGEYKNQFDIVYSYENEIKEKNKFEKKLAENDLVFSCWANSRFENLEIYNKDMTCSSFKKSKLENITVEQTDCIGMNLKGAYLKNCKFKNCDMKTSDWREATLENVIFENCYLEKSLFQNAKGKGIKFEESRMEEAIFSEEVIPFLDLSMQQLQEIVIESDEINEIL